MANLTFVQADLSLMSTARKLGTELPAADVVFLSNGIIAPAKRTVTEEGIEVDMAVSTLSRLVILEELAPRLPAGARVFIWGMPGNLPAARDARLDDLNAERGYAADFGFQHMNTVVANEALVHHLASLPSLKEANVSVFGMNPGMLLTAIRTSHGMPSCIECCVSCCFCPPPVPVYGESVAALAFTPGLEARTGALFGQDCSFIKPMPIFTAGKASELYAALQVLSKGTKQGVQGNPLVEAPKSVTM